MTFAAQFAATGLPQLMREFGSPATYTPPDGGAAVSLTAVMPRFTGEVDQMREGQRLYKQGKCLLATDPAGAFGGVAAISTRAVITDDATGEQWAVVDISADYGDWVVVTVSQSKVVSRERHDRRRDKRQSTVRDMRRFQV